MLHSILLFDIESTLPLIVPLILLAGGFGVITVDGVAVDDSDKVDVFLCFPQTSPFIFPLLSFTVAAVAEVFNFLCDKHKLFDLEWPFNTLLAIVGDFNTGTVFTGLNADGVFNASTVFDTTPFVAIGRLLFTSRRLYDVGSVAIGFGDRSPSTKIK